MKIKNKDEESLRWYQEEDEDRVAIRILNDSTGYHVNNLWYGQGFYGALLWEKHPDRIYINRFEYYKFFASMLEFLKNFLKCEVENKLVKNYLGVVQYSYDPDDGLKLINNLEKDGYIYMYGFKPYFDQTEYNCDAQWSSIPPDPLKLEYCKEDLAPYVGHEKSLAGLFEADKEFQEKYGRSMYMKFTPRELIKEIIDCYDENISEIAVNSFAYRSSFFQNLRMQIEFYRKLISGLTDDWKQDREYLRNYDFHIPFVDKAIPISDEELEELKEKYTKISPDAVYFDIESFKNGIKQEINFHFEASEDAKYTIKVKTSQAGRYRFSKETFRKEGLIKETIAEFTVTGPVLEAVEFNNEYGLLITLPQYYYAEFEYPSSMIENTIIPNASLGFATMQLEWIGSD